mgnify:CR=1 FL=1
MATDRCSCTRSINAPTYAALSWYHARYGFNPRHLVGQGASEASGCLAMTEFTADYESADPRTRRESLETREQLTQARARVFETPMGGVLAAALSIILLRNLCQKSSSLSTIDHKLLKPSISQIVLEHIIKYFYRNSTNICSCVKRRTHC